MITWLTIAICTMAFSFSLLILYFVSTGIADRRQRDDAYTVTFEYGIKFDKPLTKEQRKLAIDIECLEQKMLAEIRDLYDDGVSGHDIMVAYDKHRQFVRVLSMGDV